MPEISRRWLGLPAAVLFVLAPLAGVFAGLSLFSGWLLAGVARTHTPGTRAWPAIAGLCVAGLVLSALLLSAPLIAWQRSASVWSALALSAAAGVVLLGAWRTWPLWARMRSGELDSLRDWRRVIQLEPAAWRGLATAVPVAGLLLGTLALAWPTVVPVPLRWAVAVGMAVLALWPLARIPRETPAARVAKAEAAAKPLRNADRIELDTLFAPPVAAPAAPAVASDDSAVPAEAMAEPAPPASEAPSTPTPARTAAEIAALGEALYAAARGGRVEQALGLLEEGADAFAPPPAGQRDQRGLAQLAAVLPDLRLLRALIERGVPLDAEAGQLTPLLAATRDSWHGRPDAVMTLLANGSDPRACDAEGNTPLHHAARSTDPGVAALLLDAAAPIDALNHARQSPLSMALLAGNWRLAKFLVERGAKVHPAGGEPAMLAAAMPEEDDPAGVLYLLRHKGAVNARGVGGRTALQQAAAAGHVAIVQTLIDAGADVRAQDEAGLDAWLHAAPVGQLETMDALLDAGANRDATDAEGCDALMRALDAGNAGLPLVRWLRERGIDMDRRDVHGRSALDRAVAEGRWSLVAAIDPHYPLPTASLAADHAGEIAQPPIQLMREALADGDRAALAKLAGLLSPDERGRLLLEAASTEPARIVPLLAHSPMLEARNADGDSAAFVLMDAAAQREARRALQALLEAGAAPAGAAGLARFLAACLSVQLTEAEGRPLATALLERGADPFARTRQGEAPLLLALRLGWSSFALTLLERGADPNQADARGLTPLQIAAALGQGAVVPALLRAGAQPALRAADGQTALGVALASGRRELVDWLDWRGWPHPGRVLRASDLPAAAILGDADAVRRLLAMGFDVDARDMQGCSALLRAAGGGHEQVVAQLLAAGADTALPAGSGATPLSAAISRHHLDVIDQLLAAKVDLSQRLPGGVTVLMLASALGLPDVASRLLAAGADLAAGDAEGLKPMHCAGLFGFSTGDRTRLLALFDTLYLAGAEPNETTASGLTPLLLLLGARAEPGASCDEGVIVAGLERLLDEGASLAVQDQRGFGPLHLAALHGLGQAVRVLLRAGADPQLRDRLNRTPQDIAQMRGFMDVAAEFVHSPAAPSMARFLRDPGR